MAPSKRKFLKNKSSKFKIKNKKSKPKKANRDIRHRDLAMKYKMLKKHPTHEPEPSEQSESCSAEVDSLNLLLSTFHNVPQNSRLKAIESDEEDCSDEEMLEEEEEVAPEASGRDDTQFVENLDKSDDGNDDDDDDDSTDEKVEIEFSKSNTEVIEKEDNCSDDNDPFHIHFLPNITHAISIMLSEFPRKLSSHQLYWPILKNIKFECIQWGSSDEKQTLLNQINYAKPGEIPKRLTSLHSDSSLLKTQIRNNIQKANTMQLADVSGNECFTEFQKELFSLINNYQDLLYTERNLSNGEQTRFMYCLHVVNHILKARLKVIHHNERLNKKDSVTVPEEFRDQGLVRPRILILVPFRDSCYRIVNIISDLLFTKDKGNVINKSRFKEEFTGSELIFPKRSRKPEDFEHLFSGNVDDSFRIGITFTKKSLKLYADFYSSDVIIASPLGLRMLIGADGDKERDFDFLASIELLILDQADMFLMQNWDHVIHVFDHMHLQPKETHGTDFSRVRSWAVNGWSKFYRQTLIFSSILCPELIALFNRKCANYAGSLKSVNPCEIGTISRVVLPVPQIFRKFKPASVSSAVDDRFEFFTQQILPQMIESLLNGVLIYVPSYFDFVRLRNFMRKEDYNFVQICEYSKDAKVARARDMFFHDEARILLYSERFHFFHRINLKGIRHLVFYQPPVWPHFFSEMCNLMQESNQNKFIQSDGNLSVTVIYSKYDVHSLSAIVNTARASKMLSSEKSVHMFSITQ